MAKPIALAAATMMDLFWLRTVMGFATAQPILRAFEFLVECMPWRII